MCCREALLVATPEDIINIADILGVTFQDNCVATALKVRIGSHGGTRRPI
jgi:hypothetical protein